MHNVKDFHSKYLENGFCHVKSLFDSNFYNDANNVLDRLPAKVKIPFSDTPWGYGHLEDISPFDQVRDSIFINSFCKEVFKNNSCRWNHIMAVNKCAWIGPDEIWHQEVFNMATYAPGCDKENDWKNFMQVFIALDDHTIENGCIRIMPKSHTLGILECEDYFWNNHGHKRRIKIPELNNAYEKCGILNLEMKAGDALFFNHRLVHGASSNSGPTRRRAIIAQAQVDNYSKDTAVFDKEINHRNKFAIDSLSRKIKDIKKSSKYSDFKEKKK
jgi:hypothetical protein